MTPSYQRQLKWLRLSEKSKNYFALYFVSHFLTNVAMITKMIQKCYFRHSMKLKKLMMNFEKQYTFGGKDTFILQVNL